MNDNNKLDREREIILRTIDPKRHKLNNFSSTYEFHFINTTVLVQEGT